VTNVAGMAKVSKRKVYIMQCFVNFWLECAWGF